MPSPVGHSLLGLAIGFAGLLPGAVDWRGLARQAWNARGALLLCVVLANAPDIDFLFGISRGTLNFYHQTGTHTALWIALVSLSVWLIIWSRRHGQSAWGFLLILALTGSHLLADMCCADNSPPYGIMLFWPFSDRYFLSPISLFPALAKSSWSDLWSMHNVGGMAMEALVTLPLVAAVLIWKRRRGC
jgi:membrane-bound metal-dependent hydrolase YbcI (DUF457 family)